MFVVEMVVVVEYVRSGYSERIRDIYYLYPMQISLLTPACRAIEFNVLRLSSSQYWILKKGA